ncbi:MAG: fibronectin type III domain-containing protein, partial [Elusimicrobia bacterium]|nr:fibronectin type III domain-containing protein [Candidatus Obscuribacterium magneticum]
MVKAISYSSTPFVVDGATITPRTTVSAGEVIGPLGKSGGVGNAHLHLQTSSPDPKLDNTKTSSGVGNDGNDNVIYHLDHDRSEFTGRISSPSAGATVYHTASHDNERLVVSINKKEAGTLSTFNGYDLDRANFYLLSSSADISAGILSALTDDKRVNKSRARVTLGNPNATLPDLRDSFRAEIEYGGRPDAEPHPLYLDNTETPPKGRTGTETGFHTGFQVDGGFPDYNRFDIVFNQWNSRVRKNFESLDGDAFPDDADALENAEYPDGDYRLIAKLENVYRPGDTDESGNDLYYATHTAVEHLVTVDNFVPFLRRIENLDLSRGATVQREAWNPDGSVYRYSALSSSAVITATGTYLVRFEFSEPMSHVQIRLDPFGPLVTASDQPVDQRTVWSSTLTISSQHSDFNGKNVFTIAGKDLAGNELAATGPDVTEIPFTRMGRDAAGTLPGPGGVNTRHAIHFQLPTRVTQVTPTDSYLDLEILRDQTAAVAWVYYDPVHSMNVVRVREMEHGRTLTIAGGLSGSVFRGPPTIAYNSRDQLGSAYIAVNNLTGKNSLRFDGAVEPSLFETSDLIDEAGENELNVIYGADDRPRVVYTALDPTTFDHDIRFARWTPSGWETKIIEPPALHVRQSNIAVALDRNTGQMYVGFLYEAACCPTPPTNEFRILTLSPDGEVLVRRTVQTGSTTNRELPGTMSSLRVDRGGRLHTLYEFTNWKTYSAELKYFSEGVLETVDTYMPVGQELKVSLALDPSQQPFAAYSYYDEPLSQCKLRVLRRVGPGNWVPIDDIVTSTGVFDVELAIDESGSFHIAYEELDSNFSALGIQYVRKPIRNVLQAPESPPGLQLVTPLSALGIEVNAPLPGSAQAALTAQRLALVGAAYRLGQDGETAPPGERLVIRYPELADASLEGSVLVYTFNGTEWIPLANQSRNTTFNTLIAEAGARGLVAVLRSKALATPTGFAGVAESSNSIRWSWTDNASNETGYRVLDGAGNPASGILPTDTQSFIEENLSPNKGATRRVEGLSAFGREISNLDSRFTRAAPPAGLNARAVTSGEEDTEYSPGVALVWSRNGNPVGTVFEIERSSTGADFLKITRTESTGYGDLNLLEGASFYYRVRGINGDGVPGDFSETVSTSVPRIPPDAVLDLAVTSGPVSGQIRLTWTAPGDDGGGGTASSYLIRAAATELTEDNFTSANPVLNPPTPSVAGAAESLTLTGLTSRTFFAIKAVDDVGNEGAISNVAVVAPDDRVAPAAILDASASPGPLNGSIRLTWTAPGDDGSQGNLVNGRYLIDYASALGSGSVTVTTTTVPGHLESYVLTGLSSNTPYTITLRTADAAGNLSELSNLTVSYPLTHIESPGFPSFDFVSATFPSGTSSINMEIESSTSPRAVAALAHSSFAGLQLFGSLFEIGPSGVQFDPRARILFHYEEPLPPSTNESEIVVARFTETGGWETLPIVRRDEVANIVEAETSHLSLYALVLPKVALDTSPPVTTLSFSPSAIDAFDLSLISTSTYLVFSSTDFGPDASGVERILLSINGGEFQAVTGPIRLAPGRSDLRYYAVDRAGNKEPMRAATVHTAPWLAAGIYATTEIWMQGSLNVAGDLQAGERLQLRGAGQVRGNLVSPNIDVSPAIQVTGDR